MKKDLIYITLRGVSKTEYGKVRELAEIIWPECYKDILSPEQIRYMLDMMYSEDAIADDVSEKTRYRFIMDDTEIAGFLAWGPLIPDPPVAKLHKLYLLPEKQGQGVGSRAMELVKQQIKEAGYAYLRLNVNRQNGKAIKSYQKNGFETIQTVNNDIGNGFFMNDYVMETEL